VELLFWISARDLPEKREEVSGRVRLGELVRDPSGRDLQRGLQIHDAVPLVVMRMPPRTTGAKWQWQLRSFERLDRSLLIHAEHNRVVGRIQVQAHHVLDLRYEVGVANFSAASNVSRTVRRSCSRSSSFSWKRFTGWGPRSGR
jgi:hypothetical protein